MDRRLKAAYRACARFTRREAGNFYVGFLTLPRRKRRAVCAVYAFCREADDIADGAAPLLEKRERLRTLRERLLQAPEQPSTERDRALGDAIRRFGIDPADLERVIDGVKMDLAISRYGSFEDLKRYCARVASAVGLAVLPILAHPRQHDATQPQRRRLASTLGLGMQLVNILRDVTEDAGRDRIYLPQEDLQDHGISEAELRAGPTERTAALLRFEADRARRLLRQGTQLLALLPRRSRACPGLLAAVYGALLEKIEALGYDVFRERLSLSAPRKLRLLIRVWLRTRWS